MWTVRRAKVISPTIGNIPFVMIYNFINYQKKSALLINIMKVCNKKTLENENALLKANRSRI